MLGGLVPSGSGSVKEVVMALARVAVGRVTRMWGGTTGDGLYLALRSNMQTLVASSTPQRIGTFKSAGAAQQAVQASFQGRQFIWERDDLPGDIESYAGLIAVVT